MALPLIKPENEPAFLGPFVTDPDKEDRGSFQFKKSSICCMCRATFKEDKVVLFRGKAYGIPCGCSKDIAKLASKG